MAMVAMWLPARAAAGDIRVSLVTIYPGADLYEIYGHTELRVLDDTGDTFYNYGLFDFNAPGFVYRFVKGETDYFCGGIPGFAALRGYEGRRVVEQVLNLTPQQAESVRDALRTNAEPENAMYRYKFVSDNCATRPRDIVEQAFHGTLKYHPGRDIQGLSYRDMMHRYNANYAWERFGIDLALGSELDTIVSYRQQMFIPMVLMDAFAHATVADSAGHVQPLVKETITMIDGAEEGTIEPPTPWYLTPMFFALLLLAATIAMCVRDVKRRSVSRWYDTVLYAIAILWGLVMMFLIFVCTHDATTVNFNALWLHPLYAIPLVLMWLKKAQPVLKAYHWITIAELLVTIAGFALGLFGQCAHPAFYPLMAVLLARSVNYLIVNRSCSELAK